ncbi:MAG: LytTR family transcriptional regulator [Acholeplasmataceae bacterium]|jgi:DNA-binding LytR/AlgR family response regulator|nr:LytTR family transcriptional regulator [Acholeplasmataceae bacterium]
MKVELIIDKNVAKPYAIIYSNEKTEHINNVIKILKSSERALPVTLNDKIHILWPRDIYLIQVTDGKLTVYDKDKTYSLNKRLYEAKELLGSNFIQISKSSVVNVNYVESVEASFSGTLKVKLKNNLSDYISRFFVKDFKKYLGL